MLWSWLDFWLLLYWGFFIGISTLFTNLLNLLLLGEVFWVIIYSYIIFLSSYLDLFFLFLFGVYLLILATTESSIGLALLILKIVITGTITISTWVFKNYYFLRQQFMGIIQSTY